MRTPSIPVALLMLSSFASAQETRRADILVADFEGDSYGDWKVTGAAFGPGPARGTLPMRRSAGARRRRRRASGSYPAPRIFAAMAAGTSR